MRARIWTVALGVGLGLFAVPVLGAEGDAPHVIVANISFEPSAETEAEALILGRLDSAVNLEFLETPLDQVIRFLADQTGLAGRVVVDQRSLEDSGIGVETPVTLQVSGVRVRAALELVLEPLDLDWAIHKEVLFITTRERTAELLSVVTYPVADLLSRPRRDSVENCCGTATCAEGGGSASAAAAGVAGGGGGGGGAVAHALASASGDPAAPCACAGHRGGTVGADQLINALTSTVVPQTWDEVGGAGNVSVVNGEVMVVFQTRRGHEEVASFLAKLRHSLASISPAAVVASADEVEVITLIDARHQAGPAVPVEESGSAAIAIEPPSKPAVEVPQPLVIEAPRLSEPLGLEPSPAPTATPAPQPTVIPTPE